MSAGGRASHAYGPTKTGIRPACCVLLLDQMHVGQGVSDPECTMDDWEFSQKEVLGHNSGNTGVGQ